jgi:hypothetical protein
VRTAATCATSRSTSLTHALASGHTIIIVDDGADLIHFDDDNNNYSDTNGKIRFINLLATGETVSVWRDGGLLYAVASGDASAYDEPIQGQHQYVVTDSAGKTIVTEPYFVNADELETVVLLSRASRENPLASAILLFDYPQDHPNNA